MAAASHKVLRDVMEEHLEEAGFLWTQWESALDAPDYTLDELAAREEQRLVAHLDALVLGGPEVAGELLMPALEQDEAETCLAAALAMTAGGQGEVVLEALGAAGQMTPGVWGLRRALELCTLDVVEQGLRDLIAASDSPLARALALEALAFHGAHAGPLPEELQSDEDPHVTLSLLRAARVAPGAPAGLLVERGLHSERAGVRDAALETGLLLGQEAARARCASLVQDPTPGCRVAMGLWALLGDLADGGVFQPALGIPELRLDALWALGYCGSLEAAELCMAALQDGDDLVAAAAAEALCAITGLNLQASGLVRAPEPADDDDEGGLTLATVPEENLLAPDVDGLCAWWEEHSNELKPGARLLMGRPAGPAALARALHGAPLWRRHLLALKLSARSNGDAALRLQTRTWCVLQQARVRELAGAAERGLRPGHGGA